MSNYPCRKRSISPTFPSTCRACRENSQSIIAPKALRPLGIRVPRRRAHARPTSTRTDASRFLPTVSAAGLGALFNGSVRLNLRVEVGRSVPAFASLRPTPCADGGGRVHKRSLRVFFCYCKVAFAITEGSSANVRSCYNTCESRGCIYPCSYLTVPARTYRSR